MGRSKRNKVVPLTKTVKKTKSFKEDFVIKIRESLDKYENLFVFSHTNMRTNPFRDIQQTFNDSKFFLGKNKVMQFALGRTEEEEIKKNLHLISEVNLKSFQEKIFYLSQKNAEAGVKSFLHLDTRLCRC